MEKMKKSLTILNLTGEFVPELRDYFASRGIQVVEPLKDNEEADWTHIITKDIHNFDLINDTYKLTENDRFIISLSKVNDLQNFTINNGNLVLDDCWFKGPMGSFILDKYFQGYGGITLGENYPAFNEQGSFNVANPFNTGEYLDRMVHTAFENGVDALTLKTYFDHLVMYLAGMKKKGKIGLPFEVTYGSFEDIFAVQVHFFSQQLEVMDISTSLSSTISKKAEEYLLNTAVQSSDFFDFSYMPEVNKVIVTALWTKDERITFENRGLMFMSLNGGNTITKFDSESSSSFLVQDNQIEDHSDKVVIPDTLSEEETTTVVKGSEPTEDEAMLIKGSSELEEFVQTIKGKFEEEDKSVLRISGDKLDVDKVAFRIANSVDETAKDSNLKVRSLNNQLPQTIKSGLFDFAKNLNKPVEDLSNDELSLFQVQRLPDLIKDGLQSDKQVIKNSPVQKQKDMTVQSRGMMPAAAAANTEALKAVESKLLTSNAENEKLRTQLKALSSEVRILKESRLKMAEIQMKASQAAAEVTAKKPEDHDEELRKHFQHKLLEQKTLNEQDLKKLSSLLERESKLIADIKQEESKARKLQIEAIQKETFFAQELEKVERQNKSKDLILIKTKETFTKLIERKEAEANDLKQKVDQLTKALATGPSQSQVQMIRDLEKQNQNLNKQIDVYKIKISSLASNIHTAKADDNSKEEARKLQMLNQQMKNQLDVAKKDSEKWQAKAQAETAQVTALKQDKAKLEQLLKKATLENAKEAAPTINVNDQEMKRLQAQNQILETQLKDSSQKITNLEAKLAEASKPQKTAGGGDDSSKVKVTQLENSVKKLTQDLVESRNQLGEMKKETNKLRQDKTALQNQLDKLKKEADKAKPAMPKKPGGKAA